MRVQSPSWDVELSHFHNATHEITSMGIYAFDWCGSLTFPSFLFYFVPFGRSLFYDNLNNAEPA
jgi:hypothetical protein